LILQEINKWDGQSYKVLNHNCIDFVDAVVRTLGYPAPSRNQTPTQYVGALRKGVDLELARQEESRRQAGIERRQRIEAERADNSGPRVDVSGTWGIRPKFVFYLLQKGSALTVSGYNGIGSGRFTAPYSFTMTWGTTTLTATVTADGNHISWSNKEIWNRL
jgi:hypothetical protein